MNTHDIELPQGYRDRPWDYDGDLYTDGQVRAAIEADRQRRGEQSKCPECSDPDLSPKKHWQDGYDDGVAAALRRGLTDERIRQIWKETRARMGVVAGDPVLWFARAIERTHGISAPQPSEPVKVPSDDALADALINLEHDNYEQSYSGYKNRQADVALIRAALAAMGEPAKVPADQVTANLAGWLSAALEDPNTCQEMKDDILAWMEAGYPNARRDEGVNQ